MLLIRLHATRPLLESPLPTTHDELEDLRDLSPRETYRWAQQHGWSNETAGNWAAWCAGIDVPPATSWTLAETHRLLFLRYLSETDRLGGPG